MSRTLLIEEQLINKILNDRSLQLVSKSGLEPSMLMHLEEELKFIIQHHSKYGNVPDVDTFAEKFNDFNFYEVSETDDYLLEGIFENAKEKLFLSYLNRQNSLVQQDASMDDMIKTTVEFANQFSQFTGHVEPGKDIIKHARERFNKSKERNEIEGTLGITTGIKELDECLHGWMPEDFVSIVGRTNEGKSWVLIFFLVMAWSIGKKRVLLYSGEMGDNTVGWRFDTFFKHFSNSGLMQGKEDMSMYEKYIEELEQMETPFIVITPKRIGNKKLDIPTLQILIERYKPDIVGIDQLSLMDDHRKQKGDPTRIQYTHISEDLYATSEKYQIPILAPVQANREAKKRRDSEAAPELEDISESDGVGQNATRVISIRQYDNILKIVIKKNRYGKKEQEFMFIWDIDSGYIKPFMSSNSYTDDEQEDMPLDYEERISNSKKLEGEDLF